MRNVFPLPPLRTDPWWLALLLIAAFPLFGHLNNLPIQLYDEARLAFNAIEMAGNGNWLVTYFNGVPDLWNTKPPLLIWCQALLIRLFGPTELTVRLPVALAALATLYLLWRVGRSIWHSSLMGFLSGAVLLCLPGYVAVHGARTGDYDVFLTLWTTLYAFLFWYYAEQKGARYGYLFFAALGAAVLTKGIAGLLLTPALLVYLIYRRRLLWAVRQPATWLGLAGFLIVVLGYYGLREWAAPGYLEAVWNNELGGRFGATTEGHTGSLAFYLIHLVSAEGWGKGSWLVIPALVWGLAQRDPQRRQLTIFTGTCLLVFLLIISLAQTKLWWYALPAYPFLAILIGGLLHGILTWLKTFTLPELRWPLLPALFAFGVLASPYIHTLSRCYLPKPADWEKPYFTCSYVLRQAAQDKLPIRDTYLLQNGYGPHTYFYVEQLNRQQKNLGTKNWRELVPGDRAIAWQDEIKMDLERQFDTEVLGEWDNVKWYLIRGTRNHD